MAMTSFLWHWGVRGCEVTVAALGRCRAVMSLPWNSGRLPGCDLPGGIPGHDVTLLALGGSQALGSPRWHRWDPRLWGHCGGTGGLSRRWVGWS